MIIFLLTIAASLAAVAGGFTALRSRKWLSLAMSLTSGLILGLVTFDLLPELFDITKTQSLNPIWPMITLTVGFLLFHTVEKFILLHHDAEAAYGPHRHPYLGITRAVAIAGHSFLDGLSIGVGFQVSPATGMAVALAVIGHRFADGFDTANYMLFHQNTPSRIQKLLAVVVFMPVLGGLTSLVLSFSEATLAIYLGFFAGFLLYLAASNISPQAHSKQSSYLALGLTAFGAAFMFLVTRFI